MGGENKELKKKAADMEGIKAADQQSEYESHKDNKSLPQKMDSPQLKTDLKCQCLWFS